MADDVDPVAVAARLSAALKVGIQGQDAAIMPSGFVETITIFLDSAAQMLAAALERDRLAQDLAAALRDLASERSLRETAERRAEEAETRGENRAYAQVVRSARRVYAHPGNDISDARAVMTFAERFLDRAIAHDPTVTARIDR